MSSRTIRRVLHASVLVACAMLPAISLADILHVPADFPTIQAAIDLVGEDHVALGSDYDGVGPTLPVGLEDVSTFPNLVAELLRRGYSDEDVRKVLGGNAMRVWRAVEAAATK